MTHSQPPIIKLQDVYFLRADQKILQDINWTIYPGQHWALLGLNGSGKTSLMKILSGYEFPSSGQVEVLGHIFGKSSIPKLRERIGLVTNWLSQQMPDYMTVEDVILTGKFASIGLYQPVSDQDRQAARVLLDQFNLAAFGQRRLSTLSQGERQNIFILRALITEPDLLILDEPNNSLDLFAREQLLAFIEDLVAHRPGLSLMLITHHTEDITAAFNHCLLLRDGKIFKQGPKAEVFRQDVLADFYEQPIDIRPYLNQRFEVVPDFSAFGDS
ncbi:ABC transporter [Aerococcus urinaehominis]|uniref:ABC transporter n=1 Tax=Aerococcus urinaehominis TaxID=128944 RepID=A0A120IAS8_9LACT|nr:ABC transporter ATP-binding protein [Aerococcus urinaehominis]AMB99024.1 ABC transporter [Aerococcus urinaehominis]SDM56290.1 iron complex transport system ATP-binding protein [Aerococcus urinaehominis]